MHPRNPKVEVFDACQLVMLKMNSDFPDLMIKEIKEKTLTPEKILSELKRLERGRSIRDSESELPGFHSGNSAYGDRLLKEWEHFFRAYAMGKLCQVA